jgi:hypothetical protein
MDNGGFKVSFGKDLDDFTVKSIKKASRVKRAAAIEILNGVVMKTPVDTGRARGNWQASVNTPIVRDDEANDKAGNLTVSNGSYLIRRSKLENRIYLSNNVEYVPFLNQGSSRQAGARFVEAVVQRVKNRVNREGGKFGISAL